MREIVFDTETTGVNPATGDRMVEIGCVELVNRCPMGREYHAYFNPERPMPDRKSTRLTSSHTDISRMPSSA